MKQSKAAIYVLLAGVFWGSMGVFVRVLNAAGLYAMDIVQARMLSGLLFVGGYMLLFARDKFRIRLRDLWCFLGTGCVSILIFSWCYFSGMQETSLSVMGVLLYTSPAVIMILSIILFHEKLTKGKLLALFMTFAGCCLVSGLGSDASVSLKGLLLGLGAGFFYALYSIFSRFAIDRGYSSWTITFYTFLFCMLGGALFADWGAIAGAIEADATILLWMLGTGFVTAFLAFGFYTKGLEGMEPSRAGILASTEPVVGTLFGTFVFHEPLTLANIAGIVLVLGGIVVLSAKKKDKA